MAGQYINDPGDPSLSINGMLNVLESNASVQRLDDRVAREFPGGAPKLSAGDRSHITEMVGYLKETDDYQMAISKDQRSMRLDVLKREVQRLNEDAAPKGMAPVSIVSKSIKAMNIGLKSNNSWMG